jgi:multidrug resistance protein
MKKSSPLLVLFITIFIDLVGFGIIIPILPIYADDLGAPGWMIGLIAGSFSMMQFLFAPFWGGLSDRIGRRPVILISIIMVALSYLIFANSTTLLLLFVARILAGIGSANISAAQAFISDITTPENRAKNFGIIGAAFGLGFIFGPPLGGFLKTNYGIEWVGYVSAILAGTNLILAYFLLPESLKEKNKEAKFFPNPFSELKDILPREDIRSFLLINFVFITAFSMMQITAALMWENFYGLTEAEVGYVFAFIGLTVVIIQGTLIGRFIKFFGEKNLFVAGNFLMAIGLLAMPYVPLELFIPLELIALLFISFGNAFFTPTLSSLLSKSAGKKEQGRIMGMSQSVGSLSRVIGPLIGGTLYAYDRHFPYIAAACIMLITALMAYRIVRTKLN